MSEHISRTIASRLTTVVPRSYAAAKLMSFDHVYPSPATTLERPPRTAVLYASLSSDNFWELHSLLYAASRAPKPHLEYVLRPIPPTARDASKRSYLSGYGVALDLKKMDYLALDDRTQGTEARSRLGCPLYSSMYLGTSDNADQADEAAASASVTDPVLTLIHQYPGNTTLDASAPLSEEELLGMFCLSSSSSPLTPHPAGIGLQATQIISDAADPLSILKQLSQNFPRYATALARQVAVDAALAEEAADNQAVVRGGLNVAWLNGVQLAEKDMNPFAYVPAHPSRPCARAHARDVWTVGC